MLADDLLQTLRDEYRSGRTQCDIAAKHNVTQTYIQCLLSGKRKPTGITLGTLQRMFPHATLNLRGASSSQVMQNRGNGNRQIMGTSSDSSSDLASYQLRLYHGLAGLDISDDAKAKVLALIQSAGEAR